MARIYFNMIKNNNYSLEKVPAKWYEFTKQLLIEAGLLSVDLTEE